MFRARSVAIRAEGKHVSPGAARLRVSRSYEAMEMGNAEMRKSEKVMRALAYRAAAGKRALFENVRRISDRE